MVLNGEPGWIRLMCCNIDSMSLPSLHPSRRLIEPTVFFSVLVLHWITSKDNASTLTSSQNQNANNDPPSPRRLVPRPARSDFGDYETGLREYSKAVGVMTVVTAAVVVGEEVDEEMKLERINNLPPNVVTVETEYVREVTDIGLQGGEREKGRVKGDNVVEEQQIERTGSEDDLFRR